MSKDDRKAAEKRLADAQERLAKAADDLSDAQVGLTPFVSRDVPDVIVEVLPDNVVSREGKQYESGDTVHLAGPEALALVSLGHARIVGVKE